MHNHIRNRCKTIPRTTPPPRTPQPQPPHSHHHHHKHNHHHHHNHNNHTHTTTTATANTTTITLTTRRESRKRNRATAKHRPVFRGDLDWKLKTLELQNYNRNEEPCNGCRANVTTRDWQNFDRDAPCQHSLWTTESWKAAKAPIKCPLFLAFYMSIWAVHEDFLHTMHLGIYQWMFGSVLWLLTYILLPGTPLENSKRIMSGLRTYWRMHPTNSFNIMRPSMFERANNQFPQLKGRASEIKHLAPGLLSVWETHCSQDPADEVYIVHQQIALMIKWFIRLDVILDQHPPQYFPKLPDPEAAELNQNALKCSQLLNT